MGAGAPDYEPLDLGPSRNAGPELLPDGAPLLVGEQAFRGLPFRIGTAGGTPDRCFVAFGPGHHEGPVTVPVGTAARTLVVAHRLLESTLLEGGPAGQPVAEWVFRYEDGAEERALVRERFEISVVPTIWGMAPFRAQPDQSDAVLPREAGPWGQAGRRQTEVDEGVARCYFLWCWTNPRPARPIVSLTIVPCGPRFLVGGVTLGRADEHPFVRAGAETVKITLLDPADAARPGNLDVRVDRGVSGYAHVLPGGSDEEFLRAELRGFGEPPNPGSSPAYASVAAVPSATVTVRRGEETLGACRWGELQARGAVETPRLRIEAIDPGRNWVRTRIVDADTGEPVPCRVHFRSPDGVPYQPHGHHQHVNSDNGTFNLDVGGDARLGRVTYAYVDGACEGWLPRGAVLVDVARGFEYEPLRARVEVEPGQQELTLRLKRWADLNRERWFSGDTHVHFLSTQGCHLEAMGEDLNVVNLLLSQWGSLFTNVEDFTGGPSVSQRGPTIVYASQENRQHFLGHLNLLGLKTPVMPWCSDGPKEAEIGGTLEVTLSEWADRCHAQGGTVILPHVPVPNGEPVALVATGRVDAIEMVHHLPYGYVEYYRYLNSGYRLPLVGGTDKMTSDVPVGLYRTYVHVPPDEEFTYESWCRNLKLGRTFLSSGPILRFSVDGAAIGDTLRLPSGGGEVEVEATAESIFPLHTLQVVRDGRVAAETTDAAGARRLSLRTRLVIDRHSWLAARVGDPSRPLMHHVGHRSVNAHTSPIYVACGEDWWMFDRAGAEYMLTMLEGNLAYIRDLSRQYPPGRVTHHHGQADHAAYLERPFLEARAALHRRLHRLGVAH